MTTESSLFGLAGKKALVIGGGQGMGEASAVHLARAGCDVALVDVAPERAARVAAAIAGLGVKAFTIVGDVLDDAQSPRIVAEADQKLGGIDRMISIVGSAIPGSLNDTTADIWDLQMRQNLRYFFLVAKEVAAVMARDGGGRIVGIASVDGQRASASGAYGAAKAGLISLVKTMAVQWAPENIRVNALAPGHIVTPRLPDRPGLVEAYAKSLIPMRRRGTTDEIGKAVLFLLSDLASYVNGTTLNVDGGLLAQNLFPHGLPDTDD